MFLPSHFLATPIPAGGFSWTLPSLLGEMLVRAEALYGPRDASYTMLGIEFSIGPPQIWYPGSRKHVVVQLNITALQDNYLARYQLAHECIHLLSPTGGPHALVLEEGLAVAFAEDSVGPNSDGQTPTNDPKYAAACRLVRTFISRYPDAIKRLRAIEPGISKITPDRFRSEVPDLPPAITERLFLQYYDVTVSDLELN